MRKTILLILMALVMLLPATAAVFRHSIAYNLYFPESSHVFEYRFDCLSGDEDGFSLGFSGSIGYGINHFTQYGSNALVYGPGLSLGVLAQYGFSSGVRADAFLGALASYSLYPQVLRGLFCIDVLFPVGTSSFLGVGAGVTFPQWGVSGRVFWGVSR